MAKKKKSQKIKLPDGVRNPLMPPRSVHNDSEGKKIKRGDFRKLKHKENLHE